MEYWSHGKRDCLGELGEFRTKPRDRGVFFTEYISRKREPPGLAEHGSMSTKVRERHRVAGSAMVPALMPTL